MSEGIVVYCRACHAAWRPEGCFPPICPNPDCQINPAKWTTFKPVSPPKTAFHNTDADRAFLGVLHISQED